MTLVMRGSCSNNDRRCQSPVDIQVIKPYENNQIIVYLIGGHSLIVDNARANQLIDSYCYCSQVKIQHFIKKNLIEAAR